MSSPDLPENKPKVKRKRPRADSGITVITFDGKQVTLGGTDKNVKDTLRGAEDKVFDNFPDLFDGANESAAVTAAAKLLDALEDRNTPERIKEKLEKHKQHAIETLLRVSGDKTLKATARAQASAQLVKAMKNATESAWPPDTSKPEWRERMARAEELCAL